MKRIFKSKKRALVSIIAIAVVLIVFVNICASSFFSFIIFKKDGWKKFEEYSYGAQLKDSSEWISEKRTILIKNQKKSERKIRTFLVFIPEKQKEKDKAWRKISARKIKLEKKKKCRKF